MALKFALIGLMLTPYLVVAVAAAYRKATEALEDALGEDQ